MSDLSSAIRPTPRFAGPEELPAAEGVWRAVHPLPGAELLPPTDRIDHRLVVVELGGDVVGAGLGVMVDAAGERRMRLQRLAVLPDCRRRGVGRSLVALLIGDARARGIQVVDAWVPPSDRAAYLLLSGFGLVATGQVWSGPAGPEVELRARLPKDTHLAPPSPR